MNVNVISYQLSVLLFSCFLVFIHRQETRRCISDLSLLPTMIEQIKETANKNLLRYVVAAVGLTALNIVMYIALLRGFMQKYESGVTFFGLFSPLIFFIVLCFKLYLLSKARSKILNYLDNLRSNFSNTTGTIRNLITGISGTTQIYVDEEVGNGRQYTLYDPDKLPFDWYRSLGQGKEVLIFYTPLSPGRIIEAIIPTDV